MDAAKLSARLVLVIALLSLCVTPAAAEPFPSRIVKLVVPQTPGGATDVFARKIGQLLSEHWGQPVIIENRAGAGGVIGTEVVAKAPPDGHTLLVTYAGSQAINASLYPKLPFDSVKDFQTVATLAVTPFILIVNPKLPAKDLAEFIAVARAKPDSLTYASSGNGSVNHLIGEMIKADTGTKILHVPYRGVAPAITDVVGGQVDSAFSSVPSVLQMVRSGNVRALAVSSARRIAVAPEIPTIAESGLPGFLFNSWFAILAPAGTPKEIIARLNAEALKAVGDPDVRRRLEELGFAVRGSSPEELFATLGSGVSFSVREHEEFWITVHYPNPEPVVTLLPKVLPGAPDKVMELCTKCSDALGVKVGGIGGMFLAWLLPGFSWAMHTDHDNAYEQIAMRVHVPILTNPRSIYVWGRKRPGRDDEWLVTSHLAAGKIYLVRVDVPHTVVNQHNSLPRLHLILDVQESPAR